LIPVVNLESQEGAIDTSVALTGDPQGIGKALWELGIEVLEGCEEVNGL
jgi:hypothetical protein